jgi:hypothetical protein
VLVVERSVEDDLRCRHGRDVAGWNLSHGWLSLLKRLLFVEDVEVCRLFAVCLLGMLIGWKGPAFIGPEPELINRMPNATIMANFKSFWRNVWR